jgi:hypothetical protein
MNWMLVSEYAKLKGISTQSVYNYIKRNKLATKKVGKKIYVSEDLSLIQVKVEDLPHQPISLEEEKNKINNELLKAKLKKIETETDYQNQKLNSIKENMLIEFTDSIIVAYTEAYAKFKNDLVELRLNESQLKTLQDLFGRCTTNFISKMKRIKINGNTNSEQ